MEKRVILIGNGQIPRAVILKALAIQKGESKPILKCKRCSTTNVLLTNGYCLDCEEELEAEAR